MKKAHFLLSFFLILTTFSSFQAAQALPTQTKPDTVQEKVKVYYFHATRRCATCQAVEAVAKQVITEYYGDTVPFESLNREEEANKELVKKYRISGQTLLVIKGKQIVNLTNDAFLNARTNPDKLKEKLKATIDTLR